MDYFIENKNGVITFANALTSVSFSNIGFYLFTLDKEINFSNHRIFKKANHIHFKAEQFDELVDCICGNKWPSYLDEYFSLVLQEIKSI